MALLPFRIAGINFFMFTQVLLKKTSVILTAEKAKETAKDEDMGDPKAAKGDI
jgi:hypothetical protein